MSSSKEKVYLWMLSRTLRWRDSRGLSRWTQNTVTSILVGEAEGDFPLIEEEEAV